MEFLLYCWWNFSEIRSEWEQEGNSGTLEICISLGFLFHFVTLWYFQLRISVFFFFFPLKLNLLSSQVCPGLEVPLGKFTGRKLCYFCDPEGNVRPRPRSGMLFQGRNSPLCFSQASGKEQREVKSCDEAADPHSLWCYRLYNTGLLLPRTVALPPPTLPQFSLIPLNGQKPNLMDSLIEDGAISEQLEVLCSVWRKRWWWGGWGRSTGARCHLERSSVRTEPCEVTAQPGAGFQPSGRSVGAARVSVVVNSRELYVGDVRHVVLAGADHVQVMRVS